MAHSLSRVLHAIIFFFVFACDAGEGLERCRALGEGGSGKKLARCVLQEEDKLYRLSLSTSACEPCIFCAAAATYFGRNGSGGKGSFGTV